jgi:hypothetical protein
VPIAEAPVEDPAVEELLGDRGEHQRQERREDLGVDREAARDLLRRRHVRAEHPAEDPEERDGDDDPDHEIQQRPQAEAHRRVSEALPRRT